MDTQITVSILDYASHHIVEKFVIFLCKELGIYPDTVRIARCYEKDLNGACIDLTESDFLIIVKDKNRTITSVFNTIAHEMIHVKQLMKEDLNYWLSNCKDIPYADRWWEVEARKESMPLVEKFTNKIILESK